MYTYENLKNDIRTGREIEFKYNDAWYSITHTKEGHVFTKFHDENQLTFEKANALNYISINGRTLKDIFDSNEIKEDDLIVF